MRGATKFTTLYAISFLSVFLLFACERNEGVQAASKNDEYQPRSLSRLQRDDHEMSGELIRVDKSGKTIEIRVENGMLQTFNIDSHTTVSGLGDEFTNDVRKLAGDEGSEVTVQFDGSNDTKIARRIVVTQVSSSKSPHHVRHR